MTVAVYSRPNPVENQQALTDLFGTLKKIKAQVLVYKPFAQTIEGVLRAFNFSSTFETASDLGQKTDYLVSIGGDGTLLDTLSLVRDSGIPVLGINLGRLGFLTGVGHREIKNAIKQLDKGSFSIDQRSLVQLHANKPLFGGFDVALNEFAIQKKDTSSMISIDVLLDGKLLNTYWADGLMVATPTGSTGYSLSCGGPIILPTSKSFVITPICPHNLSTRPIVVPDDLEVSFRISSRDSHALVTLDSRQETIDESCHLAIKKADFCFNLISLNDQTFLNALKSKLMWGMDKRN